VSATRADVVREARAWVGTPYHDCADVRGAGVDCGMLLVRVFCDLKLAPAFDPRPYKPQWYLHQSESVFLDWLERYAHRVTNPLPGDVALYNFGRHPAHGAILVDDHTIVHADRLRRAVVTDELSLLKEKLHGYWSAF
jgi:cell wall-associated NlpC family hydrolase